MNFLGLYIPLFLQRMGLVSPPVKGLFDRDFI